MHHKTPWESLYPSRSVPWAAANGWSEPATAWVR